MELLSIKSLFVTGWQFSIGCVICNLPSIRYFSVKKQNTILFNVDNSNFYCLLISCSQIYQCQRSIQNPVKHLKDVAFAKIVNGFRLLTISAKAPSQIFYGVLNMSLSVVVERFISEINVYHKTYARTNSFKDDFVIIFQISFMTPLKSSLVSFNFLNFAEPKISACK